MFLKIMPKSAAELHRKLLRTVFDAPLAFLTAVDSGVTLNRFSHDMSRVDLALLIALSVDISTLDGDALRHKLITVPQHSFTLPRTVHYNVDFSSESSEAAINAACEKVGI